MDCSSDSEGGVRVQGIGLRVPRQVMRCQLLPVTHLGEKVWCCVRPESVHLFHTVAYPVPHFH